MNEEIEILDISEDVGFSKSTSKVMKKKKKKNAIVVFAILDVLAITCLFLAYGPINHFRDLLVTTAMRTMSHKYLARTLYSEKTIQKVLANNYIAEFTESTDISAINIGANEDPGVYESIYEEQILKRDPNNPDYKIIDIKGTNSLGLKYKGYLVVVYDPSKVELAMTKYYGYNGQLVRTITKENDAIIGINASGFYDPEGLGTGGIPDAAVIVDGEVVHGNRYEVQNISGFNKDNVLVLTKTTPNQAIKQGIEDAVSFGPFLIVNGKPAIVKGNGGWGIHPRTILAQRKDGIVLFLVVDGRQLEVGGSAGVDLLEMIEVLTRYRAYNAVNLDGGASTTLVVNNQLYNKPCGWGGTGERAVPNAWIVKR